MKPDDHVLRPAVVGVLDSYCDWPSLNAGPFLSAWQLQIWRPATPLIVMVRRVSGPRVVRVVLHGNAVLGCLPALLVQADNHM
jgi:hypothetical protein